LLSFAKFLVKQIHFFWYKHSFDGNFELFRFHKAMWQREQAASLNRMRQ